MVLIYLCHTFCCLSQFAFQIYDVIIIIIIIRICFIYYKNLLYVYEAWGGVVVKALRY